MSALQTSPNATQAPDDAATPNYRAAVVHTFGEPLVVEDVPRNPLLPGQVRVEVEASGLCHTDIHAAHGDWPVKPTPPFVPGHEGVGRVVELGPGVTEVALGDRVAMPWLGYACGTCDYCVSGWETLCREQKNMGYSIDGGFGAYATAYARLRRPGAAGGRPVRRGPAHVRRCHHVQGRQGRRDAFVRSRRGLRSRRARPPRDPVRGDRRRPVVAVDLVDEKLALARELGASSPSTPLRRIPSRRSRSSEAPTRRSRSPSHRSRSSRPTAR